MRKSIHSSLLLRTFLIIAITVLSCTKSSKIEPTPPVTLTQTDTLTQNIYIVDSTASPTKGIILVAPYDSSISPLRVSPGLLLVMDQSGRALQKLVTPGAAFGFNRWIINGKTRYTYQVNDPTALRPTGNSEDAGYAVIADSNLNTIRQVNLVPFGQDLFQAGQGLDVHDFILISDSDYITLTYNWEYPTNIPARLSPIPNVSVISPVIEEVRNGVVVWNWDATSDTTFYGSSIEGNNFASFTVVPDYVHMNSVFIDPRDNNLICSMRNQNQIIKINRQTGLVMWRLGGVNSDFPLSSDQVFLRQHNATLTDNNQTLLLFDDGQTSIRNYSRVVEFHLDEVNKTVTDFKYFSIPEPFTDYTGSVQKIGTDYFIGGGPAGYLLDINYNTGQKIAEYKSTSSSYRAYKY